MAGLLRDRCRSPGRRRRSHGRALVECVPVGLPPPSLLDQLVCDMQRHLEEMERVRAVLFDAYPCLTPSSSLLCSNSSCPIRGGGGGTASSSRRSSRRPPVLDDSPDEDSSHSRGYAFSVDVTGFTPEQLTVRLEGRKLIVTGRQDRKQDSAVEGCVSREYREVRKELNLPADADLDRLTCTFNPDNDCLCIQSPRVQDKAGPERNIPINVPGQSAPLQSLPPAKESAPSVPAEESKDGTAPSAAPPAA